MAYNWGCESLDLEDYKPFYKKKQIEGALWFPIDFIEACTDRNYIQTINRTGQEKVSELTYQIRMFGIKRPGLLTVGSNGLRLSDGNHRLLACKNLSHRLYPVDLQYAEAIRAGGISNTDVIKLLLERIAEDV